jgi:hypothetical protein
MTIQMKLLSGGAFAKVYRVSYMQESFTGINEDREITFTKTIQKQQKKCLLTIELCNDPQFDESALSSTKSVTVRQFIQSQYKEIQNAFERSHENGFMGGIPVIARSKKENTKYAGDIGYNENAKEGEFLGVINGAIINQRKAKKSYKQEFRELLNNKQLAEVVCSSLIAVYTDLIVESGKKSIEKCLTMSEKEQLAIIQETTSKFRGALNYSEVLQHKIDNASTKLIAEYRESKACI